ncbi:MAG: 6-phospho-beta-glucosidase [Thermaerobacter sp.]|nr:6-phospho-beta-glucosidase [Thermaerobacter sp.]
MKIAVIGAGSSYTPELIEGVLKAPLPIEEVWLVDLPEGRERVETIAGLSVRMARKAGRNVRFVTTENRPEAIEGAAFVLNQFRVGLLRMRELDERLPLRHGVVGQETTGPGGFANAMRTIPVVREIAEEVERRAPSAWLLNFTNPAGLVTQALLDLGHHRAVGLCNIPRITERMVAAGAGVPQEAVRITVFGLNHLTGTRISIGGEDVTEQVLRMGAAEAELRKAAPEAKPPGDFFPSLGFFPNPYLNYFFFPRATYRHALEAALSPEGTRAQRVQAIEAALFARYRQEDLDEKPPELQQRGGAFYSEVAIDAMVALSGDVPRSLVLNVENNGAIPELPAHAVVERNALVDRTGIRPVPCEEPMPHLLDAVVQAVKEYEFLTVQAALEGSRKKAREALLAHPLVPGAEAAQGLLDDLAAANAEFWPTLR